MEAPTLKQRHAVEEPEIEDWDDGDFVNLDDIQLRAASTTTSIASAKRSRRDSVSSRLSMRSESNQGDDNWDIHVGESDPVKDAIAIAKSKGIPIPSNVPRSALVGGTIRRMNGEKIQKAIADDWDEDLDFASSSGQLKLTKKDPIGSPEAWRQVSDAFSPKKAATSDSWDDDFDSPESRKIFQLEKIETTDDTGAKRLVSEARLRQISAAFASKAPKTPEGSAKLFDDVTIKSPRSRNTPSILDRFQDTFDDAGFGDFGTIKVAKQRSPPKAPLFQSMQPAAQPRATVSKARVEDEDFVDGIELPSDGQLKLSTRKLPRTPQTNDDLDLEWADAGSLGTRNAGRRDVRSSHSSSASALSPSVSSAFTAESEDEGLDGLILPAGPLKFEEALKRRRETGSPDRTSPSRGRLPKATPREEEDDFAGLELGDGAVFDSAKLTLNRNIKHKAQRPVSPSKRATTTLNFTTTKSQSTISRLPRFQPAHDRHERARSNLEPVSETGAPISRYRRPESRLGGHAAQSSLSAIPAPSTLSQPSTPSRRGLRSSESRDNLRYEPPTTTNAQLLKAKRSMPVMNRGRASPTKITPFARPESRQGIRTVPSRLNIPARPKTPTERAESRFGSARNSAPFLPAGASAGQSQHISIKAGRHYRRNDSDGSNEGGLVVQRSISRLGGRPETPGRRGSLTPAELAAHAKKPITKPARRRNFGDGTELEIFDDLPTSATVESRFSKAPVGYGAPKSLFRKIGQSHQGASSSSLASTRLGTETPVPQTPLSPIKQEFRLNNTRNVPRFMQETATSRNAREQRQTSVAHSNAPPAFQNMRGEPLQPLSTNSHWRPISNAATARAPAQSPTLQKKRTKNKGQQKPFLIKQIGGDINRPKIEKGMQYNPVLYRWEGNENALAPFDVPEFHPRGQSPGGSPNSKPPALITNMNVGQAGGVQVVGGMVFDPRRMCWLKMAGPEHQVPTNNRNVGSVTLEEEEDVFAGLEDLKEEDETASRQSHRSSHLSAMGPVTPSDRQVSGETHGSGDETIFIEEFDVGPDFVKKQRNEESRWREKVSMWIGDRQERSPEDITGWRWAIRDITADD